MSYYRFMEMNSIRSGYDRIWALKPKNIKIYYIMCTTVDYVCRYISQFLTCYSNQTLLQSFILYTTAVKI